MNPIWLVHIFQMGWWKTTNESSILRSIFPMAIEVDSCAFALLFPTVSRAMREQAHDAKMKGVQSHSWTYSFLTQKSPSSQRFGWWVGDGYDDWVMRCGGIQVKDPVRKGYFLSFQRILKQNVQQTVGRWSGSCQHLIPLTKHQWKNPRFWMFLRILSSAKPLQRPKDCGRFCTSYCRSGAAAAVFTRAYALAGGGGWNFQWEEWICHRFDIWSSKIPS